MFDIGFSELLVIGVVALIVIGPEKLPRMARTVGHLAGRLQRYVTDVKADINREIELDELRKMRDSMQQAASELRELGAKRDEQDRDRAEQVGRRADSRSATIATPPAADGQALRSRAEAPKKPEQAKTG